MMLVLNQFEFSQIGRFQIFHNPTRNFCNLRDSTLHLLSKIQRKVGGFGNTPWADPLILSSQEGDQRANSVRLKGGGQMRNIRLGLTRKRVQMLSSDTASRGADDVKTTVRDALL